MSGMTDRVALITGASSGIGRATAEAFAAKGAWVVVAARRQDELASLASEIEARGGKATAIKTDVSSSKDVERLVDHAIETFGRLDYAVNNAGIEGQFAGITDLSEEDWDRVLDINLRGTFLCMKYEARAMLDCGNGGAIVNVGSVNSFLGFPSGSAYVASKHGLIGLTTSVSAELAPQGIRVNLYAPGSLIRRCITARENCSATKYTTQPLSQAFTFVAPVDRRRSLDPLSFCARMRPATSPAQH